MDKYAEEYATLVPKEKVQLFIKLYLSNIYNISIKSLLSIGIDIFSESETISDSDFTPATDNISESSLENESEIVKVKKVNRKLLNELMGLILFYDRNLLKVKYTFNKGYICLKRFSVKKIVLEKFILKTNSKFSQKFLKNELEHHLMKRIKIVVRDYSLKKDETKNRWLFNKDLFIDVTKKIPLDPEEYLVYKNKNVYDMLNPLFNSYTINCNEIKPIEMSLDVKKWIFESYFINTGKKYAIYEEIISSNYSLDFYLKIKYR